MIKVRVGNVVDVEEGIIVHGCNAHGVMGSGVAKAIRDKWPIVYEVYKRYFAKEGLELGDVIWVMVNPHKGRDLIVVNAITQDRFGGPERHANYFAIRKAFRKLCQITEEFATYGIHFPLIGAGLANGRWDIISKIIDETVPDHIEKNLWVLDENTAQYVVDNFLGHEKAW